MTPQAHRMVDIEGPDLSIGRRRRLLIGGAFLVALAAVSFVVSRLQPAAPVVERAAVWIDTVKRGPLVREVRGSGTLVPEDLRWIAAAVEGRVDPSRLEAELRIPATQAKDVQLGQRATIDTRAGLVPGRVARMDPAATGGMVTVDIVLEGALPENARPGLTIEGTIELERLADVVYVGRPAGGEGGATIQLFRLDATGHARRVPVTLGRVSASTVEIRSGLVPGDQVVLSDMSRWAGVDRVRVK
jgi:hypothetical protein